MMPYTAGVHFRKESLDGLRNPRDNCTFSPNPTKVQITVRQNAKDVQSREVKYLPVVDPVRPSSPPKEPTEYLLLHRIPDIQLSALQYEFHDVISLMEEIDATKKSAHSLRTLMIFMDQLQSVVEFIGDSGNRINQKSYLDLHWEEPQLVEEWCEQWSQWNDMWLRFLADYQRWRMGWLAHLERRYSIFASPDPDVPPLFGEVS